MAEFFEKGVVIVRGLLKGEQLERAQQMSFDTPLPNYESLGMDCWKKHKDPFLEIATQSPLVEAAGRRLCGEDMLIRHGAEC